MLTIAQLTNEGMGFEGYMAHDISELVNGNPWNESVELSALPVYANQLEYDSRFIVRGDREAMKKMLEDCKYERWKPKKSEAYYYVASDGAKEQERNNLKEELRCCRRSIKDISIESTEICKILEKYKQALDEIEKYLDAQQKYFDGEDYHNLLDIISKARGQINDR